MAYYTASFVITKKTKTQSAPLFSYNSPTADEDIFVASVGGDTAEEVTSKIQKLIAAHADKEGK